jgi:hypothetical protein
MKKIFFIILAFVSGDINAQKLELRYDTCSALQLRAGEYRYVNGQDTIKIFLRYHRSFDANVNTIWDNLWGWHEYKQGNTIIQSNYQNRFMNLPYNTSYLDKTDYSITLSFWPFDDDPVLQRPLQGHIWDDAYYYKFLDVSVTFTINKLGQPIILWNQKFRGTHGYPIFNTTPPPLTMTLPSSFVLQKL